MSLRVTRLPAVCLGATLVLPALVWASDIPVPAWGGLLKPARIAKIVNKPQIEGATFPLPAPGGPSDPTIVGGEVMWCRLDVVGACQVFSLPAFGWKALGKPAGSKGYEYRGAGTSGDPCRAVLIKGKEIKAKCKREDLSTPIGPAGVGWQVTVGTTRYCAESSVATSAIVKRNDNKAWKAIKANPPAACPVAPTPTPAPTATPTPVPYGSTSQAFVTAASGLLR